MNFVFVSGRPSLDFLGTLKWRRQDRTEQLDAPERVSEWALAADVVDEPLTVEPADLQAAIELRESMYRIITGVVESSGSASLPAADLAILNEVAGGQPTSQFLKPDGRIHRTATVNQLLVHLARDAIDLIGRGQLDRLRECDETHCTRLYLDMSRTKNRRWCGMAECGNRVKVAAFRQRAGA